MLEKSKNYIVAESKTPTSSRCDEPIFIDLADNFLEVRGAGQPIPISLAKKMVHNYVELYKKAYKCIELIDDNEDGKFDFIKKDTSLKENFESLKIMLHPDKHIVSGVFGKEIILQTIGQKNCEGIRYMFGKDNDDKTTIILVGVKETTEIVDAKNYREIETGKDKKVKVRRAEILPCAEYIKNIREKDPAKPKDPTIPEVHILSLTPNQLEAEITSKFFGENASEILFGIY